MNLASPACLAATLMLIVACGPNASSMQVHRSDDLAERQIGQVVDQAEFDREPDELPGRLDHAFLVAQPDQRLDADDLLGADVDLGLERAAETAVADGEPQPLLLRHARRHGAAHVGIEQRRAALGAVLDAVHRGIGGRGAASRN